MLIEINFKADPTNAVDAKMLAAMMALFSSFAANGAQISAPALAAHSGAAAKPVVSSSLSTGNSQAVVAPVADRLHISPDTASPLAVEDGMSAVSHASPTHAVIPSRDTSAANESSGVQTGASVTAPPLKPTRTRATRAETVARKAAKARGETPGALPDIPTSGSFVPGSVGAAMAAEANAPKAVVAPVTTVAAAPVVVGDADKAADPAALGALQREFQTRVVMIKDGSVTVRSQAMLKALNTTAFSKLTNGQLALAYQIIDTHFPPAGVAKA